MGTHDRFMKHHTKEVCALLQITEATDNSQTLSTLVDKFNSFVKNKSNRSVYSQYWLETLRTVLCLFYQAKANSWSIQKIDHQFNAAAFKHLDVLSIQNSLYNEKLKAKDLSLVLDIMILCMTLYCGVPRIFAYFEDTLILTKKYLEKGNELPIFDVKLMNCYIDSLLLHKKFSASVSQLGGERVKTKFMKNIELLITRKDRKTCEVLTQVLPKLTKVVAEDELLTEVWEMILTLTSETAETISILHSTAHVWFPMDSQYDQERIDRSMEERLWLLLQKGLSGSIHNEQKQALQLIKRVVDFTDQYEKQASQFYSYQEIRPLVCIGNDSERELFKKNLNTWFSVLEELKKDEEHCVTSLFSLLRHLVKETDDTHSIHIAWIRCAFLRILRDNNKAMVKWGLMEVLTLHLELYDDKFLVAVLDALNNTYLYEIDANEEKPTLVKELTIFLNYAETKNTDLVTRFMVQASKMTWDPVPLFQIIHALSMVGKVRTVWKAAELEAVKSLAEIILTIHCPILRIGSQIELLDAMTHFATESLDLLAVANTLSAFPTSEILIRDQLGWKRTSTWLSNTVKESEAISFLEGVCRLMGNDISIRDLSMNSLSLIIMLFYDGYLALNSKVSPGFTAVRNLLNCLNEEGSKSRSKADLKIRAIELLGCLLDVSMLRDCILNELISDYANATLRWTFKNLRTMFDESAFKDMSTYVRITQQLFMANGSIITKRDLLNHIEKFQFESRNIIEDGEFTSNVKRFFGIKILRACIKATSTRLTIRNYKFIESLHKTYKDPILQSSGDAEDGSESHEETGNHKYEMESEYFKIVAELFHEYLKDQPVDEWLPNINWIKEVLYLIQVGGQGIVVPLVGILSQIFYKGAVGATHIDDFTSAVRSCWESESNKCSSATEEILDLMFSSAFLDCEETRELTIECVREVVGRGNDGIGQSIIVLKKLDQVKGQYLCDFYEVILACALCGTVPSCVQKIELQARSYVLGSYQEAYPSYLSAMNSNTSVAARAHAVTLLHKMITSDPTHAVKLLPLILEKLNRSQNVQDVHDSQTHRLKFRILQVSLVIQPILNKSDIQSLYTFLCNKISSESIQQSVDRMMQEWILIRIYIQSETLRSKIWNLFDQGQERRVASLCSVMSVVYHVARLLSSNSQMEFVDHALEHIVPYCMSQQFNVPVYAQVIATKLYDLAAELSYPAITEKYGALRAALTKSLTHGNLQTDLTELQDDFYFKDFNPVTDYTLQDRWQTGNTNTMTLFYELPRLSNVSSDELVLPQMFEKFGFEVSNNHPLKLLNLKNVMSEAKVSTHILKSSGSATTGANDKFASQMNSSRGNQSVLVQKS